MTFESMQNETITLTTCSRGKRSGSREEVNRPSSSNIFEREWDYFVIKTDGATGKLRSYTECCGQLSAIGS